MRIVLILRIRSHAMTAQVEEYAQWLGMSSPEDDDLLWIAREVRGGSSMEVRGRSGVAE